MKNRIEHIIKSEALSNLQFANALEISPAAVTHLLSGRNNPSLDIVVRIAQKYPHYNLRWLLLGEGSVYNGENNIHTIHPAAQPDLFATSEPTISTSTVVSTSIQSEQTPEQPPLKSGNATEHSKLILCLPDGTYREFIKQ